MCGITGVFILNQNSSPWLDSLLSANNSLIKRGPDAGNIWKNDRVGLAHRRLSIIDTSDAANQPMFDQTNRYSIIFNGEIFNYLELKAQLINKGIVFQTNSDTEVLLQLYIHDKENFLNKLNGFFAFAIYDSINESIFIARDRLGVKPIYFFKDETVLVFASEMKALDCFPIKREIDPLSMSLYFQHNFIPQPATIYKNIKQLLPGHYIELKNSSFEEKCFYKIPFKKKEEIVPNDYSTACKKFENLLEASVKRRMISDVPLGAFLSGGIDSSIIVALASRFTNKLKTFSIGFRDEVFFDETHFAKLVADKFNTEHTVFSLTSKDLLDEFFSALDYFDEPFADSSALLQFILSKQTRKHVTVALSGDGADEIFGGYMKHVGEYKIRNAGIIEKTIGNFDFLLNRLPQSRNNKLTTLFRRLNKLSGALQLNVKERYRFLSSIGSAEYVNNLLLDKWKANKENINKTENNWLNYLETEKDMNEVLLADVKFVLPNDMLYKVDRMSMANSLEVRSPFLDYEVVDFAFSLSADYKIKGNKRKIIVQDTFKNILPIDLYNRPKKGFEVPLLKWFRSDLKPYIAELTNQKFIIEQGIFNLKEIQKLKQQIDSINPGDSTAKMWAIIVFQHWWKKHSPNFN